MNKDSSNEQMAKQLEQTQQYRIIRKQMPKICYNKLSADSNQLLNTASIVDFETTGIEKDDEPVSLALITFDYDQQGNIFSIKNVYEGLQEPIKPISEQATLINGIKNEDVKGKSIDKNRVRTLLENSKFLIAHNASFDRYHFDRFFPDLADRTWCCSQRQVPWRDFGFDSERQTYIALMLGFFYDEHRAKADCLALLEILSRKINDKNILSYLLDTLEKDAYYISAVGSPFYKKDLLKERKYLWEMAHGNDCQVWCKSVETQQELEQERDFLSNEIYAGKKDLSTVKTLKRQDMFKG